MRKSASIISLMVIVSLTTLSGCSEHLKKGEVLAIAKTKTYHREGCPPTNMAKTTVMTVADAKAEKFKACPGCKPDVE